MSKILISYNDEFIPIVKQLAAMGHEIITTHPPFAQQLNNLDIEAKPVAAFVEARVQQQALDKAASILCRTRPPQEQLSPAVNKFFKQGLKGFLYPRLADLVSFVLALDGQVRPDLAIIHNDVEPLMRSIATWGEAHNVPVLHVPHAVYLDVEKGNPGDDIHDIVSASHLACGGWFQREWYKTRGSKRIAETGLPQFDRKATMQKNPRIARTQLGLDFTRPVVTYFSSWRQDTNLLGCHDGVEETYLAILEVIKRMPQVQFIIKLHPRAGQSNQWHVDKAKESGVKATLTATHLESCLVASDLWISYSGSNTILDASFVPWCRLMATSGYETDPEVVKIRTDPPDIELMIEAIARTLSRNPANYSSFQAKYIGRPDGLASQRIAGLIGQVI